MNPYQQPQYPPYSQPYNTGYVYSQRPTAKNTQPLTQETINLLRHKSDDFSMKVEQIDLQRAACTHKEKNGVSTIMPVSEDGKLGTRYRCSICGEEFHIFEGSKEIVEFYVSRLIDMLQTSKAVYLDAPDSLVTQYYQIIPLLKLFPKLWEKAISCFNMYEGAATSVSPIAPGYNGFQAVNTLLTTPVFGGAFAGYNQYPGQVPQQPMYGQPQAPQGYYDPNMYQQQPQYAPPQQPMYGQQPGYGQPMANPFGYGVPGAPIPAPPQAPTPGVIPNPAGQPQQAQPQQAPQQPQQGQPGPSGEVTTTQHFSA